MTKDEIKALVAAKIAGQGSAIDAASVLPTILDAIVDAIPEGGNTPPIEAIVLVTDDEEYYITSETFESAKAAFDDGIPVYCKDPLDPSVVRLLCGYDNTTKTLSFAGLSVSIL